jgi:hypothetical protein
MIRLRGVTPGPCNDNVFGTPGLKPRDDILCRLSPQFDLRLRAVERGMRRQDHLWVAEQPAIGGNGFDRQDIQSGAGKYSTIDITYDDASKKVTFSARMGQFPGMLKNRRFNVVLITKDAPQALNLDNPKGQMVDYNGKAVSVKL